MSVDELVETLGLTIKQDNHNKLITFLCALSTYSDDSQLNVSFTAPSSTGKSYIPLQIAQLLPPEDVITLGAASPTAFFHDHGKYDNGTNTITVDLERKFIVFLDQPSTALLERIRPLLSHDQKEIAVKITDKGNKGNHRTKNIILKGYPAVVFCSANLKMDEQENTRFICLSPEQTQEKLRASVENTIVKVTNRAVYDDYVDQNEARRMLKDRIRAIKDARITSVIVNDPSYIKDTFSHKYRTLKARHQRDISRVIELTKTFAILNYWYREYQNGTLTATREDFDAAWTLWQTICESQDYNLPPYTLDLYKHALIPALTDKQQEDESCVGLSYSQALKAISQYQEAPIALWKLRQEIIPSLEAAGLIGIMQNPHNKRERLLCPLKTL